MSEKVHILKISFQFLKGNALHVVPDENTNISLALRVTTNNKEIFLQISSTSDAFSLKKYFPGTWYG